MSLRGGFFGCGEVGEDGQISLFQSLALPAHIALSGLRDSGFEKRGEDMLIRPLD